MEKNTLWVVQGHEHPWLLTHTLHAQDANWVAGTPPKLDAAGALAAKTRYRQADAKCTLSGVEGQVFSLQLPQTQWAMTPGQSAVLYDGEVCLCGGVIDTTGSELQPLTPFEPQHFDVKT